MYDELARCRAGGNAEGVEGPGAVFGDVLGERVGSANSRTTREPVRVLYVLWMLVVLGRWV